MKNVNLGGDRLGSGNKNNIQLHGFERSTHDLSYVWRNTQSVGTLVPFLCEVALPGDSFQVNLNADVKTMPTFNPLFGSYKLQLDVFKCPVRLYQGQLHNNKLGIGMKMSDVKLPLLNLQAKSYSANYKDQFSSSCLLNYLGVRGLGQAITGGSVQRYKNAVPTLAYYDIYKNYYANKQEEIGYIISKANVLNWEDMYVIMDSQGGNNSQFDFNSDYIAPVNEDLTGSDTINIVNVFYDTIVYVQFEYNGQFYDVPVEEFGTVLKVDVGVGYWRFEVTPLPIYQGHTGVHIVRFYVNVMSNDISLKEFPLSNIDDMRESILAHSVNKSPFVIDGNSLAPYGNVTGNFSTGDSYNRDVMNGLAIKTYQSDLFNNWVSTEWIDGDNGINAITSVDVSDGSFSIDTLNLSNRVYNMLMRIAVSGGSYQDWVESVYDIDMYQKTESPVYLGGLSKEIVFQEVVSNATSGDQPLGSLAGRGVLGSKHKGGYIDVKIDEPCYIIGIASITPRIDYSQGNRWDSRLRTMDDFHKPSLDGIGFQDLITEQMSFTESIGNTDSEETLFSAGKVPAWMNYMTNYNRCYGLFADTDNQMSMTLNRRYEIGKNGRILDLTTYIDPTKFNYSFAVTEDLSSMNFWLQIASDITARRKMSAKQIPNL